MYQTMRIQLSEAEADLVVLVQEGLRQCVDKFKRTRPARFDERSPFFRQKKSPPRFPQAGSPGSPSPRTYAFGVSPKPFPVNALPRAGEPITVGAGRCNCTSCIPPSRAGSGTLGDNVGSGTRVTNNRC